MQTKTTSRLMILIIIVLTAYVLVYGLDKVMPGIPFPEFVSSSTSTIPLRTPAGIIHAIVATSSVARERGLSGREALADDRGMLFVFEHAGLHGFWMKDMRFPIDIIWVDGEKRVVSVLRHASPSSYPEVFLPEASARYVLELNSGGAEKWGIATGTQLVF